MVCSSFQNYLILFEPFNICQIWWSDHVFVLIDLYNWVIVSETKISFKAHSSFVIYTYVKPLLSYKQNPQSESVITIFNQSEMCCSILTLESMNWLFGSKNIYARMLCGFSGCRLCSWRGGGTTLLNKRLKGGVLPLCHLVTFRSSLEVIPQPVDTLSFGCCKVQSSSSSSSRTKSPWLHPSGDWDFLICIVWQWGLSWEILAFIFLLWTNFSTSI